MAWLFAGLVVLTAIALYTLFRVTNLETLALDELARKSAPGQFIKLRAGTTHYDIGGQDESPVVVLVHGFSVPYYIWDTTFRHLTTAGFRVVRYDLFGRGYSDRPELEYRGQLFENQLQDLVTSLELATPINLVGLSMGGAVVARFAANNPAMVRKIVLIDPAYETRQRPPYPRAVGEYLIAVSVIPGMAEDQMSDFLFPKKYPNWADKYRDQQRYVGFRKAISSTLYGFATEDHLANYRKVQAAGIPVKLIWGLQDETVPVVGADIIRSAIPDLDYLPVDQAGHLPHIEQAATVNSAIAEFLRPADDNDSGPLADDEALVEDD